MDTYLDIHNDLSQKSYVTLLDAESICNSYPGFSWIKDTKCVFMQTNESNSEFLKLSSPDKIVGATDFDFQYSSTGHTSYDFRTIDQYVIKGSQYNKKIELLIMPNEDPLFILVTKTCVVSNNSKKPIAVLGIAQPLTQIQIQQLNGIAILAPTYSWTKELTAQHLTNAELHVQILHNKFKLSSQEIAIVRNTSKRTVDTQLYNIRVKLYGRLNCGADFIDPQLYKFHISPNGNNQ